MNAGEILTKLNDWGPLLFGLAFLAPLIAQSMEATHIGAPFGLTPLQFGLAIGATMGGVAKWRGSWI
jgi:hypothetical protein